MPSLAVKTSDSLSLFIQSLSPGDFFFFCLPTSKKKRNS
uniref:Uncharacterized protein n=1 Tax=Anguilla anguilla TaxID=7936 RepID=A0A0E9W9J7_ANGAN